MTDRERLLELIPWYALDELDSEQRVEVEAQNGVVVRLGAAAGVATPVNGFIYASLLPQERQARAARKR